MENTKISVQDLNLHYGTNHALKHVNMEIRENAITAFILSLIHILNRKQVGNKNGDMY